MAVMEPSEPVADTTGTPIFDFDINCPQCGYNLRGLTEHLCPECGNTFDPHAVLLAHRDNQPPLPLAWVVRTMYRHPLAFWEMEQVQRSQGPRRLQIFFGLICLPVLAVTACALLVFSFLMPWSIDSSEFLLKMVSVLPQGIIMSLAVYMLCLVHGILCRASLAICRQRESVRAAKEVVGYGLIWLGPVILALATSGSLRGSLFVTGSSPWAKGSAILLLGAAAMACLAWAITLYKGGKFASGGSVPVALWCAATNPLWYILGIAAVGVLWG
jgi:uncharacterized membrane protein